MSAPLIIYDCDGTLIDTETVYAEDCLAAFGRLGLPGWTMERYVDTFVGIPADIGWGFIERDYGGPLPAGFRQQVNAVIHQRFASGLRAAEGVREAVTAIGPLRCVASSTRLEPLIRNIARADLTDLFAPAIFSASQVRRGKPAPDVFLFAASQMGFDPPHCVVIEDSVPGVIAARRAGMRVIGFTGLAHDAARLDAKLREAGALAVVAHMRSLPETVRNA